MFRVEFTTAAAKQIRKLPSSIRTRILIAVEKLETDPRPPAATKLVGEATAWRLRVGNYRIIYDIFDAELLVTVISAGHRREIYRR